MEFTSRHIADVTLIQIQGRINHESAKDFEDALKPYLDQCSAGVYKKLLIDLGGVDYITSAGLRVLMIAAKTCGREKAEVAVADLQPAVTEIFKISRFDLILKVFPTVRSALDSLSPDAAICYEGT